LQAKEKIMASQVVVEFENGRKLYFGDDIGGGGLEEVGMGSKALAASKEKFEGALGTLADLIGAMEKSLDKVVNKPKKVEMEFGASIKGDCDLWIVKGEGNAAFKVTLTWES
jgi:Trypsin-co-occurring domain 1